MRMLSLTFSLTDLTATCATCGGSGTKVTVLSETPNEARTHIITDEIREPCPDCAGRGWLLDPDRLEAAASANWDEWHKGHPGGFKGAMRDMAKAAVLAYLEPPT